MKKNILRRMVQTVSIFLLQGFILFFTAWSFKWMWARILISGGVIILVINAILLPKEVI